MNFNVILDFHSHKYHYKDFNIIDDHSIDLLPSIIYALIF